MYFNFYTAAYHRKTQSYMKRGFKYLGLSFEEGIVLMNVHTTETCAQEDISLALVLDPSAVARAMKALEKKGLVDRAYDVNNQRRKLSKVTPAGEAMVLKAKAFMQVWADHVLEGLTEEDRENIAKYGKRLYQNSIGINIDHVYNAAFPEED